MLIYFQMITALIMGLITSITDFKSKKIYNKTIIIFIFFSSVLYILNYKEIDIMYLKPFFINIFISIIISFSFFYLKIWSAGDAKLFIAIIFMIPYELYEISENNYFGGLYILITTFSIAFIYVFFETIVLFIIDKDKTEKIKLPTWNKSIVVYNIAMYFLGYTFSLFFNNIIAKYVFYFYIENNELIFITNIILLFFIFRILNSNTKKSVYFFIIFLLANIIFYIINGIDKIYIDFKMIIIISLILLYRKLAEKYNYKKIKIDDLKDRMILSIESVFNFYSSKVKGLPLYTDESTDYRLTKDEVESIKRWSKTSKGKNEIVIVRHMPFAPFMLMGELIFFGFKIFL